LFKYIASLFAVCLLACSSLSAPKSYVNHLSHSTVALVIPNDEGVFRPFCSGVFIDERKILTAAHCVVGLAEHNETTTDHLQVHYLNDYEVQGMGQEPYAVHLAETVVVDETRDLAELKLLGPDVKHETAKLVDGLPDIGAHVAIVGMPKGFYFTYEEGTVSGIRDASIAGLSGTAIQIQSAAYFGNSGGGAFDENGKLIGICSRLTSIPQMDLFMAVDKDVIKNLEKDKD